MRRLWSVALVVSALLVSREGAAQEGNEKDAVMAVVKRLFDGMRAGDSAMVRSTFHPKIRLLSYGAPRGGGAPVLNIEENAEGFVKAVGTPHPEVWDERIWDEKVEIDGGIASVWVDYSFYIGTRLSHCGIDHFLLTKDQGAWKIVELADTRRREGCK